MGQDESQVGQGVAEEGESREPDEIRQEIEDTRSQMGETVQALAEKADVKAQAQHKVDDLKQTALQKKEELIGKAKPASPGSGSGAAQRLPAIVRENSLPFAVGGALLVGLALGKRGR